LFIPWVNVSQTVVRSCPQAVSEEKALTDTERMENTPIHICAKTAFVG
jgi:hypothetical protein